MAESFLQAQLKRIKDLTEQISNVRTLHHVSDVRSESSDERGAARHERGPARRPASRPSRRRTR
jgi:hypothetical protein